MSAVDALALAWFRAEGSYTYAHVVKSDHELMVADFNKRHPEQWKHETAAFLEYLKFEGYELVKIKVGK